MNSPSTGTFPLKLKYMTESVNWDMPLVAEIVLHEKQTFLKPIKHFYSVTSLRSITIVTVLQLF